jgi:hypothetical protein
MTVAGAAPAVAEWNEPEGITTVVLFLERLRLRVDTPALARSEDLR